MLSSVMWSETPATACLQRQRPLQASHICGAGRSMFLRPCALHMSLTRFWLVSLYQSDSVLPKESVLTWIPRSPRTKASVFASASHAHRKTLLVASGSTEGRFPSCGMPTSYTVLETSPGRTFTSYAKSTSVACSPSPTTRPRACRGRLGRSPQRAEGLFKLA